MGNEKQIIKDRLQKLVTRMKVIGYNSYMIGRVKELVNELQQRGVYCGDRFVQKLLDRVNDKEAYLDILMEGRFAIILARNNFSNIQIEYADKGPDLKAIWNMNVVYFEVTRSRPSEDDQAVQDGAVFVSQKRIENIKSKIQDKIPQLQSGKINVVVLWSDTVNLLPRAVAEAFGYIEQEIDDDPERYKDLSGVLFTEGGGVDLAALKEYYLFENKEASKPLGPRLIRKLKSLHERDINQVQRENEELGAALIKRLKAQESL